MIMKLITVTFLFLSFSLNLVAQSGNASNQTSQCQDKFGSFPTSFEGQKCWLTYALKDSIYVYGDKLTTDAINYKPIKITEADIKDFLSYNKGENKFYLPKNYMAWGGNWYACRNGGITHRFHGDERDYPNSKTLNWSKVKAMTPEEIYKLSPAEKLDIYLNDSNFSVTKFELQNRGPERPDRNDDGWCGFCNGARIAGAIMPEPRKEVTLWSIGPNTQQVRFSIGDIKALVSAAYMHPAFTFSFGLPDEQGGNINPHAAIFDVLLRLYLGKNKIPFVVDDAYGAAIFNETVIGYNRAINKPRQLSSQERQLYRNSERAVDVSITLYLQDELSFERSELETITIMSDSGKALNEFEDDAVHKRWVHKKSYRYTLYLDANNLINDGNWIGEPIDFAWAAHGNGNEDQNVAPNDTPGIPKSKGNRNIIWFQVKFILTQSLQP